MGRVGGAHRMRLRRRSRALGSSPATSSPRFSPMALRIFSARSSCSSRSAADIAVTIVGPCQRARHALLARSLCVVCITRPTPLLARQCIVNANLRATAKIRRSSQRLALNGSAGRRGAGIVQPAAPARIEGKPGPLPRGLARLPELALDAVAGRHGAGLIQPAPRLLYQVPAAGHCAVGKHHGANQRAPLLANTLPVRLHTCMWRPVQLAADGCLV
jgi:hypothetical protein